MRDVALDRKRSGGVRILRRPRESYQGKTVVHEARNDLNDSSVVLPLIDVDYHGAARVARACVNFFITHWQWIIGRILAGIAIWASMWRHVSSTILFSGIRSLPLRGLPHT